MNNERAYLIFENEKIEAPMLTQPETKNKDIKE